MTARLSWPCDGNYLEKPDTFCSIRASCAEKTPKMSLNIDIFSSTEKWAISDQFFDVFSGQDARIELNPFAVYQASRDTSLEYPHGVVWNILKINFFKD